MLTQVLEGPVLEFIERCELDDIIFEYDHARPHKSCITDNWLRDRFGDNRFQIMDNASSQKAYAPSKMADVWWIATYMGCNDANCL